LFKEFRAFINRGNVIDLAVAVVVGTAFGAIVTSLVNDIIMPPVRLVTQWLNFSSLAPRIGDVQIAYGNFIQAVITFLLIAWISFLLVRMVNRMQQRLLGEQSALPATVPMDVQLLIEIRDLMKSRQLIVAHDSLTDAGVVDNDPSRSFQN
jgi:large conductance mechanosensitive channel